MAKQTRNLVALTLIILAGVFLVLGTQLGEALIVQRIGTQVCLGCIGIN